MASLVCWTLNNHTSYLYMIYILYISISDLFTTANEKSCFPVCLKWFVIWLLRLWPYFETQTRRIVSFAMIVQSRSRTRSYTINYSSNCKFDNIAHSKWQGMSVINVQHYYIIVGNSWLTCPFSNGGLTVTPRRQSTAAPPPCKP